MPGCKAALTDRFMANPVDLAKKQTQILLEDNWTQLATLTGQHEEMSGKDLQVSLAAYREENAKLTAVVEAQHHEVSKALENVAQMALVAVNKIAGLDLKLLDVAETTEEIKSTTDASGVLVGAGAGVGGLSVLGVLGTMLRRQGMTSGATAERNLIAEGRSAPVVMREPIQPS